MGKLAERIRKNRELKVVVGRWTFIARRPTDEQGGTLLKEIFGGADNATLTVEQCFRIARERQICWIEHPIDDQPIYKRVQSYSG